MSDDLRDVDTIDRGARAERLLKDELLTESIAQVKAAIAEKWAASPVRDNEGREYLFLMSKALNDVVGALEQAVRDGKVALHLREEKRRLSKIHNLFR